jgi:hypothetical protein
MFQHKYYFLAFSQKFSLLKISVYNVAKNIKIDVSIFRCVLIVLQSAYYLRYVRLFVSVSK